MILKFYTRRLGEGPVAKVVRVWFHGGVRLCAILWYE
jgi:hypothetical protein